MSDLTFSDIGKMTSGDLGTEKALPMGTFTFQVVKARLIENQSTKDNAPAADFVVTARPIEPKDDVNSAELEGLDLKEEVVHHRIGLFRRKDVHKVRRFVETVGVETSSGDVDTWAKSMIGSTFTAYVKHSMNKNDPEGLPNVNLSGFAKAE